MLNLRPDAKLRRFKRQSCFAPLRHPKAAEIVLRKSDRRAGESEVPRFQTGLCKSDIAPHALRFPFGKVQRYHIQNGLRNGRILLFQIGCHLPCRGFCFPHNGGKGIRRRSSLHCRLDVLSELLHRQSKLRPKMLHVPVVTGNAPPAPFRMGDHYTVCHRVQTELLTEKCKQFHRIFVGGKHMGFRIFPIPGLRPVCAARISDGGRLRHFHTDVSIVRAASTMPVPEIPRKQLVHILVRLDDGVDAGGCLCPVPVFHEHICLWLRASHRVDHKAFHGDVLSHFITARLCKVILY